MCLYEMDFPSMIRQLNIYVDYKPAMVETGTRRDNILLLLRHSYTSLK